MIVVGDDVEPVHGRHARALAVGQAQAASDALLDQRACMSRAQRHDGVEVAHVPTFLEHIDVNHDLGWLIHAFHRQQARDHLFFLRAAATGIDLDHLARVAPLKEDIGLQQRQKTGGVRGIARNHQHKTIIANVNRPMQRQMKHRFHPGQG